MSVSTHSRLFGSLRRELFDRTLIVSERHLRCVLDGYLRHFTTTRPHRSLKQLAPAQAETPPPTPIDLVNYHVLHRPTLEELTSEYKIAT
jgi:putative transposase